MGVFVGSAGGCAETVAGLVRSVGRGARAVESARRFVAIVCFLVGSVGVSACSMASTTAVISVVEAVGYAAVFVLTVATSAASVVEDASVPPSRFSSSKRRKSWHRCLPRPDHTKNGPQTHPHKGLVPLLILGLAR